MRFLFAELGASMPYREASRVLRTCGFGRMRASHAAIRRHTVAIGRDLEAQRMSAAQVRSGSPGDAADAMVVGIDDTYVRYLERLTSRQIQITAGRLERNGALGARFAFVSSSPSWNLRQFDGFLKQQGRNDRTTMRVVTDGDDGLRNLVQRSISKPIEAQLDWFHISMRLDLSGISRQSGSLEADESPCLQTAGRALARSTLASAAAVCATATRYRLLAPGPSAHLRLRREARSTDN